MWPQKWPGFSAEITISSNTSLRWIPMGGNSSSPSLSHFSLTSDAINVNKNKNVSIICENTKHFISVYGNAEEESEREREEIVTTTESTNEMEFIHRNRFHFLIFVQRAYKEAYRIMDIVIEMDAVTRVQIQDKAVYIPHNVNHIYQPLRSGRIWHKVNF